MGLCLLAGVGAVAAFAVLTAAGFVLMACAALFTVTMLAHIQAQTPATLVGKVVSLLLTVSLCAQPAGLSTGSCWSSWPGARAGCCWARPAGP